MEQIFRKTGKLFFLISFAAFFVSCVSTKSLTIEIPQQSSKELPSNIQSLTLVNRTVDEKYQNYHIDSLQNIFYKKQFNLDTFIYDIQAVDTTLKALGELLYESGRYDFVIPEDRFLEFKKNSFLSHEMPWNEVKELCELYNTDAVLSIDYYKTFIETSFETKTFYISKNGNFFDAYLAKLKINYEIMFRVYDPIEEKILVREFLRDTLLWEDADESSRLIFERLTPIKNALTETGIAVALDFSDKISINWRQEQRILYTSGSSDLKIAENLVDNENWDAAITLWQKIAESTGSKSTKSKAEYNIAVGFEILGNIDQAISWALKSYESMYRPLTYEYIEILQKRKNELKILKK